MTHTVTVSGNDMVGSTTEQFEYYKDKVALTKQ